MARTDRAETARRTAVAVRNNRGMYVDGNTARRLQEVPARKRRPAQVKRKRAETKRKEQLAAARPHKLSKETQRNREKAMNMNLGFVIFLSMVSAAVLFFCINYLQLKSEITGRMSDVAALESELSQLKEDNDAYYSQVTSNVDLTEIKQIAIGRLGMKYPSEEQTMTYQTARSSYVRQYQDIPDSK